MCPCLESLSQIASEEIWKFRIFRGVAMPPDSSSRHGHLRVWECFHMLLYPATILFSPNLKSCIRPCRTLLVNNVTSHEEWIMTHHVIIFACLRRFHYSIACTQFCFWYSDINTHWEFGCMHTQYSSSLSPITEVILHSIVPSWKEICLPLQSLWSCCKHINISCVSVQWDAAKSKWVHEAMQ